MLSTALAGSTTETPAWRSSGPAPGLISLCLLHEGSRECKKAALLSAEGTSSRSLSLEVTWTWAVTLHKFSNHLGICAHSKLGRWVELPWFSQAVCI